MMHGGGMRRIAEMEEEHAKNRGQVVRRLIRLLRPFGAQVALSLLLIIISAATQGAAPFLTGVAIDRFIDVGDRSGLGLVMAALAAVYIVGAFATRFQIYVMSSVGQKLLANLRQQVFDKIESLSLQYLESKQSGDLMSRLVNDIEALNSFISQGLTQMIGSLFALLGIMVAMLALNWQLGLAVLVVVPVLLLVTRVFSNWARTAFRRTRATIGDVSAELEEELGAVKVAQAYNRTDENVRRFAARNAANRDANVNATAITSAFSPAMEILSTLDLALIAAMGGALVIRGAISVGTVVAFLQYVQNFFRPIQTVAQMWTVAQSAFAAAERVFELIDMQPGVLDKPDAVQVDDIRGEVVFENVGFAYDREPVLEDVTLTVQPGQTVAVVGPTGAGKTTLVNLIARLYDVTAGRVLIDGRDVRDLAQRSLRAKMGIVTQDPFLFSGTVMENIRYGRLDASDEAVEQAARAANAHDFITRLPEGYQSEVGERGKLLSQGQRQLISIARAILADPRILILDEATASIDTRTEVMIQGALNRLLKGRTSFVIAHRLSTVRNADLVLVIDDGRIVERGTHRALIEANGMYADLYNRQFYVPEENAQKTETAYAS
jgi:ATP-binding cassette subfamily B protein/subfamily B ATP-binding cassette protein MsbA